MGILKGEEEETQEFWDEHSDRYGLPRKTPINPENSWLMIRYGVCVDEFQYKGKSKFGVPIFIGALDENVSETLAICDGQVDIFNKYFDCLEKEGFKVYPVGESV